MTSSGETQIAAHQERVKEPGRGVKLSSDTPDVRVFGMHADLRQGHIVVGKGARHGRSGLRVAADRKFPRARSHRARTGKVVSGTGLFANAVGGVIALLLIVYLFIALIRPEKF